jgi:hypothetical protein
VRSRQTLSTGELRNSKLLSAEEPETKMRREKQKRTTGELSQIRDTRIHRDGKQAESFQTESGSIESRVDRLSRPVLNNEADIPRFHTGVMSRLSWHLSSPPSHPSLDDWVQP